MSSLRQRRLRRYHAGDEVEPMTAGPPAPAAAVPAAPSAFLRGIERRAALFAQLQSGDAAAVDGALDAALQGFVAEARGLPVAAWPRRFWSLLLAAPALRGRRIGARWPPAFARLEEIGSGPRAALLLSLVARLPEADAAAVLGVAQPTYRLALRRALPVDKNGNADEASWHALDDAAREVLRLLPASRLVHIAQLREAALSGQAGKATARARRRGGATASPHPGLLPVLWTALAACAVVFVASFLFPDLIVGSDESALSAGPVALSEAAPPEARYDSDIALLSHRDFEQLADTRDAAVVDALGFYAWYAAGLASQPAQPLPLADADQPLPESTDAPPPETADAP